MSVVWGIAAAWTDVMARRVVWMIGMIFMVLGMQRMGEFGGNLCWLGRIETVDDLFETP